MDKLPPIPVSTSPTGSEVVVVVGANFSVASAEGVAGKVDVGARASFGVRVGTAAGSDVIAGSEEGSRGETGEAWQATRITTQNAVNKEAEMDLFMGCFPERLKNMRVKKKRPSH